MRAIACACALATSLLCATSAGAQWREPPSGVVRPAAGPGMPAESRPARYTERSVYGMRGMAVGAGVALAGTFACVQLELSDWCGLELLFTAPAGIVLGGLGGLAVWDARFAVRAPRDEVPPIDRGLARYMLVGALAGGGAGAALALRHCADCSASAAFVQNVPVGAAVGAIGGVVVSEVVRRRREGRRE